MIGFESPSAPPGPSDVSNALAKPHQPGSSQAVAACFRPDACEPLVGLARHFHQTRLLGNQFFGERILSDPQFDMLLELFIAHHEQRRVCIGDLCLAAGVPATTALRHIAKLESKGFLKRFPDLTDARRSWAEATGKAIECTAALMAEFKKGHSFAYGTREENV